jgi:hypothetical protein
LDQAEANDCFGYALTAGDFNRDGYDDLAVGVPYESVEPIGGGPPIDGAGAVHILYGSWGSGLTSVNDILFNQAVAGSMDSAEADDQFAKALAAGDFDGDGYDDLAVGVPYEDMYTGEDLIQDAGAVNIIHGSIAGLTSLRQQFWHQDSQYIEGGCEELEKFGWALAVTPKPYFFVYFPLVIE